jgi:hypothetical protein
MTSKIQDEADRKRKAELARERWRNQTPEQRSARLAQIHETDYGYGHYIGNGIPDLPEPRLKLCECCHENPPMDEFYPFCSSICERNYNVAPKKPLPSPFIGTVLKVIRH